jgi:pyruvate dehydrogenase E2 component (dihydrolipoamide acetyltransferase)
VKLGDKVSKGSVLASLEIEDAAVPAASIAAPAPAAVSAASPGPAAPAPAAPQSSAIIEVAVPDIGEYHDIPVISVLVAPGDTIAKDAPLVELESEKATMEVPSSAAGVVREVKVKIGDKVSHGSVIVTLETTASTAQAPPAPVAPTPPAQSARETTVLANVANVAPSSYGAPGTNGSSNGVTSAPAHASPAIRRFARELGVELGRLRGTGPNGRITRDDVQNFVKSALAHPTVVAAGTSGAGLNLMPWPNVDFAKFGPIERKPLTRIQKISGPNLARNWVMIPHVTQHEDADVTELEEFRKAINAEQRDLKVTMLALMIKASVAALKKFPLFNTSLDGAELVFKQYYNIGFAADTPNGLLVPVIKDADKKGVLEIARETGELAGKARDGKLGPADMSGATFTISSLGGIGGTYFTPIINAPEVAILGACRTAVKPVWDGKTFVPRTILPLSLSYDHRVIDGASAARFATYLAGVLADMRRTIL